MSRRRTQLLAVLALAVGGGALTYVAFGGIEKNLVYYLAADELLARGTAAHGATVRLGGVVQRNSLVWKPETLSLAFRVGLAPEGPPAIAVESHGAPPQMFQEGIGAVVEGQFDGQVFRAERVLVKHSNEYRPPAPGERPEQVYGTLVAPSLSPVAPPQPAAVAPVAPARGAP
jgi:cytochrome c-type biogenesis protein CcmE